MQSQEYGEYLALTNVFQGERYGKLMRKVDFHVLPQLTTLYLLSFIDRTNIGNAKLFSAMKDLNLTATQWNIGQSAYFITFSLVSPFPNIILKRIGPRIFLPSLVIGCALVTIFASLQSSLAGWVAFRLLLGAFSAGLFPGCSVVMTNWYSVSEIHTRMAIFFTATAGSGAFSGLLAYGIGQLDGTWGYHGWRFIYAIEGLLSLGVAILAFWFIPNDPATVGSWLSAEEKKFLVLRRRYSSQGIAEAEIFSWKYAEQAFTSIHTYAIGLIEFALNTTIVGITFTLPTIVANMGYSAVKAQAMTIPPYIFACAFMITSGFLGDRYRKRMLAVVIPNVTALLGFCIVIATAGHADQVGVTYFGIFLITGGLYSVTPASTAWISLNSAGSMKRGASIGCAYFFGNMGGIVGSNIYLAPEAPKYLTGFGVSIAMVALFGITLPIIYHLLLKHINAKRDAIPEHEIREQYSDNELSEMGDRSPLFRYST